MAFFKDKFGAVLFVFVYVAIATQIIGVYITWDYSHNSYLPYHKIIFSFISVLAIWSHIRASTTDPGKITHQNNPTVIEFYLNLHELGIKRAERFNETYGRMFFEKIDEDEEDLKKDEEDEESDYDESEYQPITSIPDEKMNKISKSYNIELKRCVQCYVVRTPRVHHCSVCKGCIIKMDHHCPWINNCVGQFNQKFFLQFCYYCFLGCVESAFITVFYLIYRQNSEFKASYSLITIVVIQLVFSLIFTIFTVWMLSDQWSIIEGDTTLIDLKQKRFLERRELSEILNETFGGGFGLHWFLPIKVGGCRPFFNKLKNRLD